MAEMCCARLRGKVHTEHRDFTTHVNITNAKFLALALVLASIALQAFLRHQHGSDTCRWLLSKGHYYGNHAWQPYGCMLHEYSQVDATKCFQVVGNHNQGSSHFVFVGDSRIRQLFFGFLRHVDAQAKPFVMKDFSSGAEDYDDSLNNEESHSEKMVPKSLHYNNVDLALQISFYWRPVLNRNVIDLFRLLANGTKIPVPEVVVMGCGAQEPPGGPDNAAVDEYVERIMEIGQAAENGWGNDMRLIWKLQDSIDIDDSSGYSMTNELIDRYNKASIKVLGLSSRFNIWHTARLVTHGMAMGDDGIHLGPIPLGHQLQMLLNLYCNQWMDFDDGTCCRPAESITILQALSLSFLFLCMVLSVALLLYRKLRCPTRNHRFNLATKDEVSLMIDDTHTTKDDDPLMERKTKSTITNGCSSNEQTTPSTSPRLTSITALGRLCVIMAYFYVSDRANIFMKENKSYSTLSFFVPVGLIIITGLFFNKESRSTQVLHRDQTDEWKGWMQLVILIYHMTGASKIIPLYMQMRLLVSSYLFLTGYGHMCYFWNGGSASLTRLFQVVFRINFLTLMMCLVMNRNYQLYYFVPLVTFWYVIVYILLALPPKANAKICEVKPLAYLYIISKFIVLIAGITALYYSEAFFKKIFLFPAWKDLFVAEKNGVQEWWFRWSLDRYSICFGMAFAFVYLNAQKYGLIEDKTDDNLVKSGIGLTLAVSTAVVGLGGYTTFTFYCHNKPDCNAVHSLVAFIPIVSFVLLRNLFGSVRKRYSSFFAWFGRISLELFIGQYHGWLAADTHGMLVLIPDYPVVNVCITSLILICLAHDVHIVTGHFVNIVVPPNWKLVVRNLVLFSLALLPAVIFHDRVLLQATNAKIL